MITEKNIKLNRYEVETVLSRTEELLRRGSEYAQNLQTRLRNLSLDMEIERRLAEEDEPENTAVNTLQIAEDVSFAVRFYVEKLYALVRNAPACEFQSDPQSYEQSYYNRIILRQTNICACLEPDAIYIRTPILCNVQNRSQRRGENRTAGSAQSKIYREAVRYAITACDNYGSYPFEEYAWKMIHFFYVYHGLPANRVYICDNDNHETKHVIDAITHFFPLGDHPLSCEIHASATLSDEVEEGTYITVTRLEDGLKSRADILKFWKEREEKCPEEDTHRV